MDVTVVPDVADGCGRPQWKISKIETQGGTGYANNSLVSVLPSAGDVVLAPAAATVTSTDGVPTAVTLHAPGRFYRPVTGDRDVPILAATVGGGAVLSVSLEQIEGDPPAWKVSGVGVRLAGAGVSDGAAVTFTTGDRTIQEIAAKATAVVDSDGGVIGVLVTDGGQYYRDTNLPPRVADVTFNFGGGVGGVVKGVVEDDPADPRFGQVVDLTIQSGGSGYLGWTLVNRCQQELNGREIVLRAEESGPLVTACVSSCYGSGAALQIVSHRKPRLFGRLPGSFANELNVILEETGAAPKTWRVARVLGGPVGGTKGDPITIVPFPHSSPTDPNRVFTMTAASAVISDVVDFVPIVTVTNPGQYYSQAETWDGVAGPIPGVRLVASGSGYAKLGRSIPTVEGKADGNTMAVSLSQETDGCQVAFWAVEDVALSGSKVTEGRVLTITADPLDTIEVPALVVIHTRQEPSVTVEPPDNLSPEPSQPAVFTATLVKTPPSVPSSATLVQGQVAQGIKSATWAVADIAVDAPGRGYPPVTRLEFVTSDEEVLPAAALAFADDLGRITSAVVETGGEYYRDEQTPQEYTLARSGVYYRQDASLPPYIATPQVAILQVPPSAGVGAEIEVAVDSDTASATFGQLVAATVTNGGEGYKIRGGPGNCVYSHTCPERSQSIRLNIAAENVSAQFVGGNVSSDDPADILEPTRWRGVLANADPVADCDALTANPLTPQLDIQNGQITIDAGGQYHEFVPCCYCPCDKMVDFRDLSPCGITSIIVVVTVTVANNGDPGRCTSRAITLTLTGEPGPDMWYAEDNGPQFQTVAFLNCIAGKLAVVYAFNNVTCNSLLPQGLVVLESQSADPALETCCPIGGSATFGDPLDVQVTVNVTTVMA